MSIWKQPKTDKSYFDQLFRISKNQIIFGGNYFVEEINRNNNCWIVWDKCNDSNKFADCELAWTSFNYGTKIFRYMWNGMMQGKSIYQGSIARGNKKNNEKRIHPNQKPIDLYIWILKNFGEPGWKLLDTHVGSASSLIAFDLMGYSDFLGFEKEKIYYDMSVARINDYKAQIQIREYFEGFAP